MTRVRQAGERIEELLGILRSASADAAAAAEELVRLLLGLYGDGLSHIMDALAAEGEAGGAVRDRLLADPVVESLLLLHDLHPLDVDARIQRALDRVRPYLGSHAGGVEYLGVGADGVARLRLEGSCHGCPSSTVTVQLAIQGARTGRLVLVHDMSFIARRSEETRKYLFLFFIGLGGTVSLLTVVIAQLSWRGWVQGLRALLRGEGLWRPSDRPPSRSCGPSSATCAPCSATLKRSSGRVTTTSSRGRRRRCVPSSGPICPVTR